MNLFRFAFAGLGSRAPATLAQAKPIAFAHGTTVMAEYGAGTMIEAQVFYAPKYFFRWAVAISSSRATSTTAGARSPTRASTIW